jgi:hypothetical protein
LVCQQESRFEIDERARDLPTPMKRTFNAIFTHH